MQYHSNHHFRFYGSLYGTSLSLCTVDVKCKNNWTVKTVLEFDGTEIGKGNGLMFIDDGEIVFYAASSTGSPSHPGRSIRGSINFQTGTKGKFFSLDDKVGVFELDFDVNQNYSLKTWEWN